MNEDNENFLEKTTEIKQGHADVGPFVIGVISTITLICIVYLTVSYTHLTLPTKVTV